MPVGFFIITTAKYQPLAGLCRDSEGVIINDKLQNILLAISSWVYFQTMHECRALWRVLFNPEIGGGTYTWLIV